MGQYRERVKQISNEIFQTHKNWRQKLKKTYRHCFRFINGYRHGLTGGLLDYAVKKYKSHRAIPAEIITTLQRQYDDKRKK